MGVAVPVPPIHMAWGDFEETFESLRVLGQNLQFVIEHEYLAEDHPRPNFRDAQGQRYRILVISLEVVFCVAVPPDFDPLQLELATIHAGDSQVIAEHLGGVIHRALSCPTGQGQPLAPISVVELEELGATLRDADAAQTELSWFEFDTLWFSAVDPAPPVDLGAALRRLMSRLVRRRPL
jgi:hypothetical protein